MHGSPPGSPFAKMNYDGVMIVGSAPWRVCLAGAVLVVSGCAMRRTNAAQVVRNADITAGGQERRGVRGLAAGAAGAKRKSCGARGTGPPAAPPRKSLAITPKRPPLDSRGWIRAHEITLNQRKS